LRLHKRLERLATRPRRALALELSSAFIAFPNRIIGLPESWGEGYRRGAGFLLVPSIAPGALSDTAYLTLMYIFVEPENPVDDRAVEWLAKRLNRPARAVEGGLAELRYAGVLVLDRVREDLLVKWRREWSKAESQELVMEFPR
jgi:hypothetical protein